MQPDLPPGGRAHIWPPLRRPEMHRNRAPVFWSQKIGWKEGLERNIVFRVSCFVVYLMIVFRPVKEPTKKGRP